MHTIKERPVVVNGQIVIRPIMVVALTYDHRLLDGREAVTFLGAWYRSLLPRYFITDAHCSGFHFAFVCACDGRSALHLCCCCCCRRSPIHSESTGLPGGPKEDAPGLRRSGSSYLVLMAVVRYLCARVYSSLDIGMCIIQPPESRRNPSYVYSLPSVMSSPDFASSVLCRATVSPCLFSSKLLPKGAHKRAR